MNTLVIVLISAVCLLCGYMVYGRWLQRPGVSTRRQRHLPIHMKMDRIMYLQTAGSFSHTSFPLSQVPVL